MEKIENSYVLRKMVIGAALNTTTEMLINNGKSKGLLSSLFVGALSGLVEDIFSDLVNSEKGLLSGVVGGTAAGFVMGAGNAIINKRDVLSNCLLYAGIGIITDCLIKSFNKEEVETIQSYYRDNTSNLKEKYFVGKSLFIDKDKLMQKNGVITTHIVHTNVIKADYETVGSSIQTCLPKFISSELETAYNIVSQLDIVKNIFNLFDNSNKNILVFKEHDITINDNVASTEFFLRTNSENEKGEKVNYCTYDTNINTKFKEYFMKNASKFSCGIVINIFPRQLSYVKDVNLKIARLALTIGHELFIHNSFHKAVINWNNKNYQTAWNLSLSNDDGGMQEHKNYMVSKNQNKLNEMVRFENELKSFVKSRNNIYGISITDVNDAISVHDNTYISLLK